MPKEEGSDGPRRLLVPTAGYIPARERAAYIIKMAKRMRGEVFVVHIIEDLQLASPQAEADGKRALNLFKQYGEEHGVKVRTFLEEGPVIKTLLKFADDHEVSLIVMGTSEDQLVAEWIVSDIREKTETPVVVVPFGFSNLL